MRTIGYRNKIGGGGFGSILGDIFGRP